MQAQDNPAGSLRLTPRGRAYGQRSVRQQRRIGINVPSRVRILHRARGTGCGSDVQRVADCGALPSGGVTRSPRQRPRAIGSVRECGAWGGRDAGAFEPAWHGCPRRRPKTHPSSASQARTVKRRDRMLPANGAMHGLPCMGLVVGGRGWGSTSDWHAWRRQSPGNKICSGCA
jgi:hypothetical protein